MLKENAKNNKKTKQNKTKTRKKQKQINKVKPEQITNL
jgi:hypothetical protein